MSAANRIHVFFKQATQALFETFGVAVALKITRACAEGETGNPSNFWAYWTGETANGGLPDFDPGIDWEFSNEGVSSRVLEDGSIDGWYNAFDDTPPRVPTVVIPAPPMLGLLLPVFFRRGQRR